MTKFSVLRTAYTFFVSFILSSAAFAGCGPGGVNPLANIPNLTPAEPAQPVASKPTEVDTSKVASATSVTPPAPPAAVGKIVWTKGVVQAISPDKKVRDLSRGAIVFHHDVLVTKKGSQTQVVFSDHTMLTISEDSTIYINKYQFKPEGGASAGQFVMDLIQGGFRTITGVIAKTHSEDYQVKTAVATIGVRGTDYSVNMQACKLLMKNNKGTPFVQNEHGTLVLTKDSPYAAVELNKSPIVIKTEPLVFKTPLPIVPATFTPPKETLPVGVNTDKSTSGGGGKACGIGSGGISVKYK